MTSLIVKLSARRNLLNLLKITKLFSDSHSFMNSLLCSTHLVFSGRVPFSNGLAFIRLTAATKPFSNLSRLVWLATSALSVSSENSFCSSGSGGAREKAFCRNTPGNTPPNGSLRKVPLPVIASFKASSLSLLLGV